MVLVKNKDLIYPELSYQIIGCAFDVFNHLGSGHKESVYQKALKISFREKGLEYKEQLYHPVMYNNVAVGRNYFDFLIEQKIIIELKIAEKYTKAHYNQVVNYLKISELKLALLLSFGREGVKCRRVINFEVLNK
jgi:GxxExxY protein